MSFDPEKTRLAESLRRALGAMQSWPAARRLQYLVMLGVKNRKAEFTREFGGEAMPESDSVAAIGAPDAAPRPLVKLLYVLKHGDDICLNAPTARSITGESSIANLIRVLKEAESTQLARRTEVAPRELAEADRDSIVGIKLTDEGKRYVDSALHQDVTDSAAATR